MVEVKVINGKVAKVGTADNAASHSDISTLPVRRFAAEPCSHLNNHDKRIFYLGELEGQKRLKSMKEKKRLILISYVDRGIR